MNKELSIEKKSHNNDNVVYKVKKGRSGATFKQNQTSSKPLMSFSTLRNTIISLLLIILGSILGFRYGAYGTLPFGLKKIPFIQISNVASSSSSLSSLTGSQKSPEGVDFDTFWEAWSLLESNYLEADKLDATEMVNGAIAGMTSALGDPYTVYLTPENSERSSQDLAGSFYGTGIELGYIDGTLAAVAPTKDSPAEKSGIQAGDLILHVKDKTKDLDSDTTGWSLFEAVNKIRGEKGVPVTLTIWRDVNGGETMDITIYRDEIVVKSVELEFVEHAGRRVAHLQLMKFGERTLTEWNEAVAQILLEKNNINGIVLDMRNNPGGFFETSIEIASDFIEDGVVVSQKGKYQTQDYKARGKARLTDFKTIILVNKGSASAAEIVAGALRDDLSVKLVGEKTFGKGTVQDIKELSNGGGMHITVGRWLLPKGSWIHDEGITVDVEVQNNQDTEEDEVLFKAIEEL